MTENNFEILTIIAVIAIIVSVLSIIVTLIVLNKMKKFESAYISLQKFTSGADLEILLKNNFDKVEELINILGKHGSKIEIIENKLKNGIDRAELVRFNSFKNMGAELSFALALLNQEGSGILLTAIQSIEECRIYGKMVENGEAIGDAKGKLSKEEKIAIEKAYKTIRV